MKWKQHDWRTYVSSGSEVAVALHFNEREWFIVTADGGEVTGKYFSTAEEAMSYADQLFEGVSL